MQDHIDLEKALVCASVQKALGVPDRLESAQVAMLRLFLDGNGMEPSRIAIAAADLRRLSRPGTAPGEACAALADIARSNCYAAGAAAPQNALDDYPSAPILASKDVAMSNFRLGAAQGFGIQEAIESMENAFERLFEKGACKTRHVKAELLPMGADARAANAIISELRDGRAGKR